MKDDRSDIQQYRQRWKAAEEIEVQELRALTAEQHWRQINALARFAIGNNLQRNDDDGEMQVFLRWAKLRNRA